MYENFPNYRDLLENRTIPDADLIEPVWERVRNFCVKENGHPPLVVVQTELGRTFQYYVPQDDQKIRDVALALMRMKFAYYPALRYLFIAEGWMVMIPKKEVESYATRPKDDPNRVEVVECSLVTRDGCLFRLGTIVRDETDRVSEVRDKLSDGGKKVHPSGSTVRLLPSKTDLQVAHEHPELEKIITEELSPLLVN